MKPNFQKKNNSYADIVLTQAYAIKTKTKKKKLKSDYFSIT